jgi:hypothetical protein
MEARRAAPQPSYPFQLSLRIRHPSIDPEEISQRLGIDAEHSFRAGEPRDAGRSTVAPVHAESYWLATIDPGALLMGTAFDPAISPQTHAIAFSLLDSALVVLIGSMLRRHADFFRQMQSEGGEVLFTRNVNIYVGELPSGSSARAERIARVIDSSGVRSTAVPDVLSREWTKFVAWAGLMLMSITTRAVTWRYLSDPDCALVLVRLVREVAGIAKAAGVGLTTEDTLLPLQGILGDSEQAAVQAVLQAGRHFQTSSPNHRLSSLQDLEAGRPLEIQETLGYAVRRAQELQQPVPLLDALYHLAVAIDRTR